MTTRILFLCLCSLLSMNANAQRNAYVCYGNKADAFDTGNLKEITFSRDSIVLRRLAYSKNLTDSIVFRRPLLKIFESGWWGNLSDGTSRYQVRNHFMDQIYYVVTFSFVAVGDTCQSASCRLSFDEEWMRNLFLRFYHPNHPAVSDTTGSDGSPTYISVKQTQTGPRRREDWHMRDPVLPDGIQWVADGNNVLNASCTEVLKDRPMEEVQTIIEAWLHQ